MYGYKNDDVKINNEVFGLNAGNTFLTKFEYTMNGGKGGSELEALDIIFTINGKEKSYRIFPIVKAYLPNNGGETTDPNSKEFQDAVNSVSQVITHIIKCFVSEDVFQKAMEVSKPDSFKAFCTIAAGLLPSNYKEIPLDIFLQWQWNIKGTNKNTFLEIPTNMKSGRWLNVAVPGTWTPVISTKGLQYVNEESIVHPFQRSVKFMEGNNAKRQEESNTETANTPTVNPMLPVDPTKPATINTKNSAW